jgi:hypothetical protein
MLSESYCMQTVKATPVFTYSRMWKELFVLLN